MANRINELPIRLDIPSTFFEEEERCGYLVSRDVKEIWAVELDLLNELTRVCRKHNIQIYAEGGTLLGCIRHKGFIPWDDDIDIAVTREDYNKLCAAASDFKHPYFFQTEQTDPGSMRGHAQLRNSLTTGSLEHETELEINQGIFIDIFPMDVVPDDIIAFEKQKKDIYEYKEKAFFFGRKMFSLSKKSRLKRALKMTLIKLPFSRAFLLRMSRDYYRKFEMACSRFNSTDSKMYSLLSFKCEEKGYIRKRSNYDQAELMPFEFTEIPVPSGYDNILTTQYGNYMEPVRSGNWHGGVLFDTVTPYGVKLAEYNKQNIQ